MGGKYHDLVKATKKYKGELHSFFLDLDSWRSFKSRYKLQWHKIAFHPSNRASIPKKRGIYVFTLELTNTKLPQHGYILYVGITGNTSKGTLHSRYAQYLREKTDGGGRPAVVNMLNNWADDLYFNFVPLENLSINLKTLEGRFINAVMPPINKTDFEAEILAPKQAAF